MSKLTYKEIKSKPQEFLALTSLTVDEFEILVRHFEKAFQEQMAQWCLDGSLRTKRRYSTYQNCPLATAEDRLLFALSYLKGNPLQSVHGTMFGMAQCKVNTWLHVLLPALRTTFRNLELAPCRSVSELAERLAITLRFEGGVMVDEEAPLPLFCHDGTERRIERPQNAAEQKANYSGKRQTHTVKNLLLIDRVMTILLLSDTYAGSVHDKRVADDHPYSLPEGSWLLQDLGFFAFSPDGVNTLTPIKRPKGGELTAEQKAYNQQLAALRIRIEHVNSSVKRCRIIKEVCRLRLVGARDAVMEIACSLHNFRITLFPWTPLL